MACACADCSFAPSATKSFCMSTTIMTVVLGSMLLCGRASQTSLLMAPHSEFASCERGVKPIREGHVLARIGDKDFSFGLMVRVRHPLPWRSLWLTRLQCH